MTKEQLESALDHENVEGFAWVNADEYSFSRECEFYVRGVRYEILWYVNMSYLYVGELFLSFDNVFVSGNWPNNFAENIHFILNDEVVAVLPLTEY